MDIYSIYKITNTINDKVYIGFTKNFERRMVEHTRNSKKLNSHLYYAIRTYGIEMFEFEIIYQSLDADHTKNIMEQYFIDVYDSYYAGYNMTLGGDGSIGRTWSDEQKHLISVRNKGQKSLNKGKTYIELYGEEKANKKIEKMKKTITETCKNKVISNENRKRISDRLKKYYSKKPGAFTGKNHTAESKQKISEKRKEYSEKIKGKTYKEIYGEEKANEIAEKKRIKMLGENNPRYGKPGTFTGRNHSAETIAKTKGKTFEERFGDETATIIKEKMSKARSGVNNPMYGKVGAMKGKHHSPEAKMKMKLAQQTREKPIHLQELKTCPHCQKTSTSGNASRWHFDNCKFKPN